MPSYRFLFLGEASPTKIDREQNRVPTYPNLSTLEDLESVLFRLVCLEIDFVGV